MTLNEALENYQKLEKSVKEYLLTFDNQKLASFNSGLHQSEISAFLNGRLKFSYEKLLSILQTKK